MKQSRLMNGRSRVSIRYVQFIYSHKSIPFRNPFHSVLYCNNTTSLTNLILVINIAIVRNNDVLGSSRRRLNILCLSSRHCRVLIFAIVSNVSLILCFDILVDSSGAKYYDSGVDLNDSFSYNHSQKQLLMYTLSTKCSLFVHIIYHTYAQK